MANLQGMLNFIPQKYRTNIKQALNKALTMVDPSKVNSQADLQREVQRLGIPNEVINSALAKLEHPLATFLLGAVDATKKDFQNGLQPLTRLDQSSALTSSSLLQGIDQLK